MEIPKPLLAIDVDGTYFKSSLLEKTVNIFIERGIFEPGWFEDAFYARKEWQLKNTEGKYLAYLSLLVRAFKKNITGVDVFTFNDAIEAMIPIERQRLFIYPQRVLRACKLSHYCIAISGSPEIIVRALLDVEDLDDVFGSKYEFDRGKFNNVSLSVRDKSEIVNSVYTDGQARRIGSIALGDTMSDAPLLESVENPIMFNASQTLTDYGKTFQWPQVFESKDRITAMRVNLQTGKYEECEPDSLYQVAA